MQNHTLKNKGPIEKNRGGSESSNPIQVCNQNTNKNSKNIEDYQHRLKRPFPFPITEYGTFTKKVGWQKGGRMKSVQGKTEAAAL